MALKLITAGSQAVTTADAKAHLNVTHSTDDTLITALVLAAQGHIEQVLGAPLTSETWEQSIDGFPCGPIRLLRQPVTAIASVKYDVDGVETTLPPADYTQDLPGGRVWAESWPTADAYGSVRVRFTAGYSTVPAPLKAAVLLMVGDLYANREAVSADVSFADNPTVTRLLWPYRMML
jgi:uncharacterized phiE125 gp8 family phage protein